MPANKGFRLLRVSNKSMARTGRLLTGHGSVATPFFMPIATRGAVKAMSAADLELVDTSILLSNTYHLWQRPGLPVIKKAGGLHKFIGWDKPILTDSGGYQVFSLARRRKIFRSGAGFISEIDGRRLYLTPEKAVAIQQTLGSDIMMSLDECPPFPCSRTDAERALEITLDWARRGLAFHNRTGGKKQQLFAIIQGSVYRDLRQKCARVLVKNKFSGYAVGGLAVGESVPSMYRVLDWTVALLPAAKPRYLMGVGEPDQIFQAVRRGIDMFDCVLPSRNARHGQLYVWGNKKADLSSPDFYKKIRIKQSRYAGDLAPLDKTCHCPTCRRYSRAYLRHLFLVGDPLVLRLASQHNIFFYLELMGKIRGLITSGRM